ncbi:MAG: hypothetical protein KJZ93_07580 [Caldilineaceae bacterium]|nr:hypothetical protein [Caldilineaceae bacterium]
MAYTLSDHFRPLRVVLRINGVVVGSLLGVVLLTVSRNALGAWGLYESGHLWPLRLAGALLMVLGLLSLVISGQRVIGLGLLAPVTIAYLLLALVLLSAYFQREFSQLSPLGSLLLVIVFSLCLVAVLAALPYLRAEYRT